MTVPAMSGDHLARKPYTHGEEHEVEADETTQLLGSSSSSQTRDEGDDAGAGVGGAEETDGWDGYKDFKGLPWWHRPSVFWLLGPFILFTLAFGGVMVPKLNL